VPRSKQLETCHGRAESHWIPSKVSSARSNGRALTSGLRLLQYAIVYIVCYTHTHVYIYMIIYVMLVTYIVHLELISCLMTIRLPMLQYQTCSTCSPLPWRQCEHAGTPHPGQTNFCPNAKEESSCGVSGQFHRGSSFSTVHFRHDILKALQDKIHGSLNVPIEHHPTIRYMVYNGYYKVIVWQKLSRLSCLPFFHGSDVHRIQ